MSRAVVATDGRMPLVEHIRELRNRMAKALLAVTVGVVLAFIFWEPILDFLRQPLCKAGGVKSCQLYAFGPLEAFGIQLKTSLIAGAVLSSPLWLYQLGAFITPALHKHERRYAAAFVVVSTVLFGVGCTVAYLTLDRGLSFLLNIGGSSVTTLPGLKSYLNFVTLTLIAFGIAFLFPVLVVFLNIVGLLPVTRMRAWRRGMIVGIAVMAAVLTPSTDPFTFMFMAIPLYGMYEVCIVIARVRERAIRRRASKDPVAMLDDDMPSAIDVGPTPEPSALDASDDPGATSLRG